MPYVQCFNYSEWGHYSSQCDKSPRASEGMYQLSTGVRDKMVDPNIHMRDATHENVNGDCKVTFAEKNTKKMVSLLELEKVEVITMPLETSPEEVSKTENEEDESIINSDDACEDIIAGQEDQDALPGNLESLDLVEMPLQDEENLEGSPMILKLEKLRESDNDESIVHEVASIDANRTTGILMHSLLVRGEKASPTLIQNKHFCTLH